jgi:hypothetical protein
MPGTNVPGIITAGTFYQDDKRVFWDVHHPEKTIVIDLHDERDNELVVEVDDPAAAMKLIQTTFVKPISLRLRRYTRGPAADLAKRVAKGRIK